MKPALALLIQSSLLAHCMFLNGHGSSTTANQRHNYYNHDDDSSEEILDYYLAEKLAQHHDPGKKISPVLGQLEYVRNALRALKHLEALLKARALEEARDKRIREWIRTHNAPSVEAPLRQHISESIPKHLEEAAGLTESKDDATEDHRHTSHVRQPGHHVGDRRDYYSGHSSRSPYGRYYSAESPSTGPYGRHHYPESSYARRADSYYSSGHDFGRHSDHRADYQSSYHDSLKEGQVAGKHREERNPKGSANYEAAQFNYEEKVAAAKQVDQVGDGMTAKHASNLEHGHELTLEKREALGRGHDRKESDAKQSEALDKSAAAIKL